MATRRAWRYRAERARTRTRQALNDALLAFFQGRYASAEKAAATAMEARRARRGRHHRRAQRPRARPFHAARGLPRAGAGKRARRSTRARLNTLAPDMLLSQAATRRRSRCSGTFRRDARNVRLLRMRHVAETQLRQWDEGAFNAAALAIARRPVRIRGLGLPPRRPPGHLRPQGQDAGAPPRTGSTARESCGSTPPSRPPPLATNLAARGTAEEQSIVESALEAPGGRRLVALYADAPAPPRCAPSSSAAEKWLPRAAPAIRRCCWHSASCACAGPCGARRKATSRASLALEPTHEGHMTLAALMEKLGKPQEGDPHFRRSAETRR